MVGFFINGQSGLHYENAVGGYDPNKKGGMGGGVLLEGAQDPGLAKRKEWSGWSEL